MKVLLIDVNCKSSSTGKIVYDLYRMLRANGHEAAICYGRGKAINEDDIYKFGLDWETNLHAGLARITGLNGYFSCISTRRLIHYIENYNPDVIHIHELHAYFVNIKPLLKYLSRKKIKIIWTFHCEYMYTGKCGHAYDCEHWKKECGNCPSIKAYPKSILFDFTRKMFRDKKECLNKLDFTIVTPSNWLAERVRQSFLQSKNICVVHNGIETDTIFYPRETSVTSIIKKRYKLNDKKIVLSVAPDIMSESKGGNTVLKISKHFRDTNVHFVLVGANYNEVGNQDNVTFIKKISDQNELAYWYSIANVFLICSKRENFPTTCLEALCCGTPIVGLNTGGTKETAIYPYGIFCEPGDIKGVVEAIRQQLTSDISSVNIREYGYHLYSKQVMYSSYFDLYSK